MTYKIPRKEYSSLWKVCSRLCPIGQEELVIFTLRLLSVVGIERLQIQYPKVGKYLKKWNHPRTNLTGQKCRNVFLFIIRSIFIYFLFFSFDLPFHLLEERFPENKLSDVLFRVSNNLSTISPKYYSLIEDISKCQSHVKW